MKDTLVETEVTYTVEHEGRLIVIEHVPARVCQETGEQLFSPETVEKIHALLKSDRKPAKTISAPVYEFASVI